MCKFLKCFTRIRVKAVTVMVCMILPSFIVNAFETLFSGHPFIWREESGIVEVHYNPENQPSEYSLFEAEMGVQDLFFEWSEAAPNLELVHMGTTSIPCDFKKRGRGIIKVCWAEKEEYESLELKFNVKSPSAAFTIFTPIGISIYDVNIILRTDANKHLDRFKRRILHEGGHAIGLDHENDKPSIMNVVDRTLEFTLQEDDKAGAAYLYPLLEPIPEVCAIEIGNWPQYKMSLPYVEYQDQLYQVHLEFEDKERVFNVMDVRLSLDEPIHEACILKVTDKLDLWMPRVWLGDQLYFLNLYYYDTGDADAFRILSYGESLYKTKSVGDETIFVLKVPL